MEAYSKVFWKNYKKIDNYRKYIERIERGEAEIAVKLSIERAIEDKFFKIEEKFREANPGKQVEDITFKDIEIEYEHPVS